MFRLFISDRLLTYHWGNLFAVLSVEFTMTPERFRAAFTAWTLAIESKVFAPNAQESLEDAANLFGRRITNKEDMEEVSDCFDWDEIVSQLDGLER